MVYGLFGEGARAGGFNNVVTRPDEATFGPEESKNYELGIKATFFDRRLRANISTYYVDWSELQIASRSQDPNNIFSVVRNTGNAIASGFEVETAARIGEYLQVGLNYAYMNPRFKAGSQDLGLSGGDAGTVVNGVFTRSATAFTSGPCGVDSSICRRFPAPPGALVGPADVGGVQLARTINHQWNAFVDVEAPLTGDWKWFLNADWSLQGKQPLLANLQPFLDSYSVVNARLGVKNERYEIALWSRNLTDEEYLTAASNQPRFHVGATYDVTFGQGQTYGITAKVNFGAR
jgi:outer membrane receptor protein involved in Fe transport